VVQKSGLSAEYLFNLNALYLLVIIYGVSFVFIPINSLFIAAGFAKYNFVILVFISFVYLATAYGFGLFIGIYGIILAIAIQFILNKGLKIYFLIKHKEKWGLL